VPCPDAEETTRDNRVTDVTRMQLCSMLMSQLPLKLASLHVRCRCAAAAASTADDDERRDDGAVSCSKLLITWPATDEPAARMKLPTMYVRYIGQTTTAKRCTDVSGPKCPAPIARYKRSRREIRANQRTASQTFVQFVSSKSGPRHPFVNSCDTQDTVGFRLRTTNQLPIRVASACG
jgi:hypothetical protein